MIVWQLSGEALKASRRNVAKFSRPLESSIPDSGKPKRDKYLLNTHRAHAPGSRTYQVLSKYLCLEKPGLGGLLTYEQEKASSSSPVESYQAKQKRFFRDIDALSRQKRWARVFLQTLSRGEQRGGRARHLGASSGSGRRWRRNGERRGEDGARGRRCCWGRSAPGTGLGRPRSSRENRTARPRPRDGGVIGAGQLPGGCLSPPPRQGPLCSSQPDQARLRGQAMGTDSLHRVGTQLASGPSHMAGTADQQVPPGHRPF